MFPSADRIAVAIVMAARLHGEDPLSVASGVPGGRSRVLAYAALAEAWPQARKAGLSRCCAFISPATASAHLNNARKAKWWSEDHLDEIVGALVADEVEPERPVVGIDVPHFEPDERRLIARMRAGGADAGAIAAALGASAEEVGAWLATQEG